MEWQEYIVGGIALAVAAVILRRLWCFARGRRKGGCASCGTTQCPLRKFKKEL